MISLDIDGTLLDDQGGLPLANLQAIQAAKAKGAFIILNTGKPAHTFARLMDQLHIADAAIALTGGMIVQKIAENGWKVLKGFPIHPDDVAAIAQILRGSKATVFAFSAWKSTIYVPRKNQEAWNVFQALMKKTNFEPFELVDHTPLTDPAITGEPIYKICINSYNEPEINDIYDRLQQANITGINFALSAFATIDIHAAKTSKQIALEYLANYYDVPRSQVMAFGDHETDLDVIRWAGFGAVMANAPDYIKKQAPFIAPSNEDCGVAYVINKFLVMEEANGF
jgi:Cof subfamily protein (haloacid dehalogenase superfamily)